MTSTSEEMDARELQADSRDRGSTLARECQGGQQATVSGTIRALTLRPVGGVPALEAELYDGSGSIKVVWLGRRKIQGIAPGTTLSVQGRVTIQHGVPVIFNPFYELHA